MAELSIVERVQNGATWLDENEPGWAQRIDPVALNIESCARCILGQLYGDYINAPEDAWAGVGERNAVERGFSYDPQADDPGADNRQLNAEWRRLIESRRTAVILGA